MDLTISFRVTKRNASSQPIISVDASTKTIKVYNKTIKGELEMKGVAIEPIDAQTLNLGLVRCVPIQIGEPYEDGNEFYKAAQSIKYYFATRINKNGEYEIQGFE